MLKKHSSKATKEKVVKAYKCGNSIAHLAEIFGYHRNSIRNWINEKSRGGDFCRKRNPGSGRIPKIDCKTGKQLLRIIKKPASKYGFETDFWTIPRMLIVCKKELKLNLSKMSLQRTLKRYEYSYKKPQKRYYETDTKAQQEWIKTVVPKIKRTVKKHKAILYFEDESNISLSPVVAKTWSPIGKNVVQRVTGNRGSVSAISAISSEGRLIFNLHNQGKRYNSDDIIDFLGNILDHHKRRHIVVVMDQASCHRSKKVKSFIESQKRLDVFFYLQGLQS